MKLSKSDKKALIALVLIILAILIGGRIDFLENSNSHKNQVQQIESENSRW